MKKKILLTSIAAMAACAASFGEICIKPGETIGFLGDSITAYGNTKATGYVNLVMKSLEISGAEANKIPDGVGGSKSGGMAQRVDKTILSKKPQWMTLSCGVNDILHHDYRKYGQNSDDDFVAYTNNVVTILDKCAASNVTAIVMTASLLWEAPDTWGSKQIDRLNEWLIGEAKRRGLAVADVNADLKAKIAELKAAGVKGDSKGYLCTVDGIHMNFTGDCVIAWSVLRAMGMPESEKDRMMTRWRAMAGEIVAPETAQAKWIFSPGVITEVVNSGAPWKFKVNSRGKRLALAGILGVGDSRKVDLDGPIFSNAGDQYVIQEVYGNTDLSALNMEGLDFVLPGSNANFPCSFSGFKCRVIVPDDNSISWFKPNVLKDVALNDKVHLPKYASLPNWGAHFNNVGMKGIVFGTNLTSVGGSFIVNCAKLETVEFQAESVKLAANSISGCGGISTFVFEGQPVLGDGWCKGAAFGTGMRVIVNAAKWKDVTGNPETFTKWEASTEQQAYFDKFGKDAKKPLGYTTAPFAAWIVAKP